MKKFKFMYKNFKFPTIMVIVTFLIDLILFLDYKDFYSCSRLSLTIMGALPLLGYIAILLLSNKFINKKYTKIISLITSIILFFVTIIYYFIILLFIIFMDFDQPIKDIKYYDQYVNTNLLDFFPSEVPKNVEDIIFIYSPKLLQSIGETSLYYVDKNLNVESFENKYKKDAIWVGYKKDYLQNKGLLNNIFSSHLSIDNEDKFKIYLFDAKCDDSGYCNHGGFSLVALNENTNEVLYTSQKW